MNKKFSLYLLIVLIAIMVITSHTSVISQRNAFRAPERIKETARFKTKHERNLKNEKRNDGTTFDLKDLSFSPGYNIQKEGPLDPNKGNARLQDYTGALGWRFDIGNNTLTNVFGYPASGDMVNCTKDGKHLCEWQGNVQKDDYYYFIDDVDLGSGTSGSPLIFQYNRNEHLGYVYASIEAYANKTNESISPIWDEQIFLELLSKLS
ncbi:hypothetical protein C2G38_2148572 [Gigaspora rosea]|uniref:Uncharacterized protein n=1 Tax=Gigaspora rosea TaxID=44941 RepID=A0A397U539_9GLOM|nr:hypothetical protein C2G38_2148572 [Gigaspora rosea]